MLGNIKEKIKQTNVLDLEKEALGNFPVMTLGILLATLFLLLVFGGWYLASKNTAKRLDQKLQVVGAELAALKDLDQEVEAYAGAVLNIQNALSEKKKWSLTFKQLNALTPKDVVYTTFSAEESGKVQISGYTPSLTSLAKLLTAFKNSTGFKNPVLQSVAVGEGRISFSLGALVAPSALKEGR